MYEGHQQPPLLPSLTHLLMMLTVRGLLHHNEPSLAVKSEFYIDIYIPYCVIYLSF